VEIDRFWVVCAAHGAEWLSGGEQGFDGFVSENEPLLTGLRAMTALLASVRRRG
jgi:hypothetical protein